MCTMQPNFNIVLVIERHISKDSDDGAYHVRVTSMRIHHEHVEKNMYKVQISHLNQ